MSLGGFLLSPLEKPARLLTHQQGRVIYDHIPVYDRPSLSGQVVKQYWEDSILSISEVTIGDEEPAYNRIWYNLTWRVMRIQVASNPCSPASNRLQPKFLPGVNLPK